MSPRLFFKLEDVFCGTLAGPSYCVFFATISFLSIHLYDLLDVLDLVHELHLCHPIVILEPAD